MTVKQAAQQARSTYRGHLSELFDFLLLQVIVRLIPLTPCLFLLTSKLKYLALLCLPMFLLVVPFVREKSAQALQSALAGGSMNARELISPDGYWKSVWSGLKKGFLLVLWASPFIGMTIWGYRVIFGSAVVGQTDVFSVILAMSNLGGGDLFRGVLYAMLIYMATLIPFCFGLAFHSGDRHALALGDRRLVKGHRKSILLAWLRSLVPCIPFAAVSGVVLGQYMMSVAKALNQISGKGLSIPMPTTSLLIVLAAFVVLLLPVIPLKSLYSAAMVRGIREEEKHAD